MLEKYVVFILKDEYIDRIHYKLLREEKICDSEQEALEYIETQINMYNNLSFTYQKVFKKR